MKHKCQSSEKKLKLNTKKKEEKRELKGKLKKNQTKQFGAMAMQIKINSIKLKSFTRKEHKFITGIKGQIKKKKTNPII